MNPTSMSIDILPTEVFSHIITIVLTRDIRAVQHLIPNKHICALTNTLWPPIARSQLEIISSHAITLAVMCDDILSKPHQRLSTTYSLLLCARDDLAWARHPIMIIKRQFGYTSISLHCYTVYFDVQDSRFIPTLYYVSIPNVHSRGRYRSIIMTDPHVKIYILRNIKQLLSNILPELTPAFAL